MYTLLLSILVLDGIFLGVMILLQAGKGGGLAAMGGSVTGTEGVLGGRQAQSFLTRSTWVAGGAFMVLALVLSILSSRSSQPTSILRQDAQQGAAAPEPILPTLGDQPAVQGGAAADTSGGGGDDTL